MNLKCFLACSVLIPLCGNGYAITKTCEKGPHKGNIQVCCVKNEKGHEAHWRNGASCHAEYTESGSCPKDECAH